MQFAGRHPVRMMVAWSPVNRVAWLQKLWLATVFLLLCGPAFVAIPFAGLHITGGRIALAFFLYVFVLAFLLHQGRTDVRIRVGRHVLFFGIWLLWAFASLLWASIAVYSARHIEAIIIGSAIVFFSLLFLSHKEGIRGLHTLWVIAAAIFIMIAVWEVSTGNHLSGSREAEWIGLRETYPTAVFYNPNDFATFLCLALPFMFGLLMLLRSTPGKVVVTMLLVASIYFIVLNSARANIIACLLGVGLIFLLPGVTRRLKPIITVVVVAGIVLLSGYTLFSSVMSSHVDVLKTIPEQILSVNPEDASTASRIALVNNGWAFLQQSHYLGIGAGAFDFWMTERPVYYAGGALAAHNWWLELLVDYGVVIFVFFLIFYIGLLWNLFRIFRGSHDETVKVVSLATFIALVEFTVASSSSGGLMRFYAVWLLLATALCVMNHYRVTEQKKGGGRHPYAEGPSGAKGPGLSETSQCS